VIYAGQREVYTVVRKLRKAFPLKKNNQPQIKLVNAEENKIPTKEAMNEEFNEEDNSDDDFDAKEALRRNKQRQKKQIILPTINLDEYIHSSLAIIAIIF